MNIRKFSKLLPVFIAIALIVPKQIEAATLSLSPSGGSYLVNQTFDVSILLDTQGADTSGVDAIVLFDNSKLNLTDITHGTIYDQYIGENISNAGGRATISGLANSTASLFTGTGTFATLKFRTIGTGTANVSFSYTQGNKNDTNVGVINQPGDSLTSVQNASYTISGSGTVANPTAAQAATSTTTTTTSSSNNLPVSGSSLPAIIIAMIGGFFLWLGSLFGKEA